MGIEKEMKREERLLKVGMTLWRVESWQQQRSDIRRQGVSCFCVWGWSGGCGIGPLRFLVVDGSHSQTNQDIYLIYSN